MAGERDTYPSEQDRIAPKHPPWWKRLWRWTEFGAKSGWEWLELLSALAIPVVLAMAGYWFTAQQDARQQESQEQKTQDAALQAYIGGIGELLIHEGLSDPQASREVSILARARTLTVLSRLGSERKGTVMQFLYENDVITTYEDAVSVPREGKGYDFEHTESREQPIIDLEDADLSSADLRDGVLNDAYLQYVDLTDAKLHEASLVGTDLSHSRLDRADLSMTDMFGAQLEDTDFHDADLRGADLTEADLNGAHLEAADLSKADLSSADLAGATGIDKETLAQHASSVEGAVMPDGTVKAGKYVTKQFEPALGFAVKDGWRLTWPEKSDAVFMEGPVGGQLIFTSPLTVFDPTAPSEPNEIPAPENAEEWVSWIQDHPNLDTSDPVSIPVAGAHGKMIKVVGTSAPKDYSQDLCGKSPCVPLFRVGGEDVFGTKVGGTEVVSNAKVQDWFIITDIEGNSLVIDVAAPDDKIEEFLPTAVKVLATVHSEGSEAIQQRFQDL